MISNVEVYGLDNGIRVSKYPMSVDVDACTSDVTKTVKKLGNAPIGSGHDSWLKACVVQFDVSMSQAMHMQSLRYNWFDIISSQSKMHRLTKMDIESQCNEYVDPSVIYTLNQLIKKYNNNKSEDNYLRVIYNCPIGLNMTVGVTTNYLQLKTIYYQRKNHKLPEWREFCKWIETLPRFKELVLGGE